MKEIQYLEDLQNNNPSWVSSQDSILDVMLTTLIGPASLLLRTIMMERFHNAPKITLFSIDCLCFLCPIIVSFTLFSSQNLSFLMVIMITTTMLLSKTRRPPTGSDLYPLRNCGLPFLNNYRALINLGTIIAILAVDFPQIFPQKFHKRNNKGFSLMDTGVGSFIFSHALVAPEARNLVISRPRITRIKESIMSSSMLLVLGCGRLFVTWITDYAVAEEEYGKHWNFFFTLALVKFTITILFCILPATSARKSWVLGAIVGVIYQLVLTIWGYRDWVVAGDNGDGSYSGNFIHSNRPGIFSSFGYCSLYLLGVQVGRYIFLEKSMWSEYISCFRNLSVVGLAAGLVTILLDRHVDRSSRMLANLTFVAWQLSHNLLLLVSAYLVDLICAIYSHMVPGQCAGCIDRRSVPTCACLLSVISKNQLFFFLVGNVSTGLVNLSIRTGSVSAGTAFLVVFGYGMFVCGVSCLLFVYNISTKFW